MDSLRGAGERSIYKIEARLGAVHGIRARLGHIRVQNGPLCDGFISRNWKGIRFDEVVIQAIREDPVKARGRSYWARGINTPFSRVILRRGV